MEIADFLMKDIQEVMDLITHSKPYVVPYNQYTYWILQNYYGSTCKVLRIEDKIVGYLSAMPSKDKETIFIWQLCIDNEFKGKGLGTLLLTSVNDEAVRLGYSNLQFSIADTNIASQSLFKRFAMKNGYSLFEVERVKFEELTEIVFQIDITCSRF